MSFSVPGGPFLAMDPPGRQTIAFAIRGPIARDDLPGLCKRVCAILERSGAVAAVCDVCGIVPDAVTVEALARLQLAARKYHCRVELRQASSDLRDLVAFMGLRDVLPVAALRREPRGEAEEREERLGGEEERELHDLAP
jgi:ABC-type transporter Mla MlaB component